ncbi:hypothetical protein ACLESO_42190, partial [Pyxidicoccus sp. 3LG]
RYVEARERARTTRDAMGRRARALYEAARLARKDGMEILGTETAPDWSQTDGYYDKSEYGGPRELPPDRQAVWERWPGSRSSPRPSSSG